jgi:hypothetical protein
VGKRPCNVCCIALLLARAGGELARKMKVEAGECLDGARMIRRSRVNGRPRVARPGGGVGAALEKAQLERQLRGGKFESRRRLRLYDWKMRGKRIDSWRKMAARAQAAVRGVGAPFGWGWVCRRCGKGAGGGGGGSPRRPSCDRRMPHERDGERRSYAALVRVRPEGERPIERERERERERTAVHTSRLTERKVARMRAGARGESSRRRRRRRRPLFVRG